MARTIPSGSPERPTQYLKPRRRGRLMLAALAAPIAALAGVFIAYRSGYTEVASPGPVVLRHAPIESNCQECHQASFPHRVADVRCERCHDPRVSGRLGLDAHLTWTPAAHQSAARTPVPSCASCHTDHAGRLAPMRSGGGSASCATCHRFTGLGAHPEFALVDSGKSPVRGLRFNHALHIDETRRTLNRGCEACHRSTADLSGFEPTSFTGQCAACHLSNGVLPVMTDPIAQTLIAPPAGGDTSGVLSVRRPGRGRFVVSGLSHRDPWVLQSLARLNRGLTTDEDAAELASLRARADALERARTGVIADATRPDVSLRLQALEAQPRTETNARLIDRLRLELERRFEGTPPPISLAARLSDERGLEAAIAATAARLATVSARLSAPPVSPEERTRRADAIQSLVGPCLTCHVLKDGREFEPVTVDARRLVAATFTHAPHVSQVSCETCHEKIGTSTSPADLTIPALATCRKCHATGQAPATCATCHRYHPASR